MAVSVMNNGSPQVEAQTFYATAQVTAAWALSPSTQQPPITVMITRTAGLRNNPPSIAN
ncbi:hypothetical protein NT6N_33070 [Oceaniferula spumae]|uniref:Uncharacterized protein n=1 Tax=Oceaniferula spumae TaxID=2979115 RepID=A0AAT9FQU8_9BACT